MKNRMKSSVSTLTKNALVLGGVFVVAVSMSSAPAFSKGKDKDRSENHGATASSLGALNAAHANENAFANASPNSRVGLIALYQAAVEETGEAQSAYDLIVEDLAAYDGVDEEGNPIPYDYAAETDYESFADYLAAYAETVDENGEPTEATAEFADANPYWETVAGVADAETALEEAGGSEADALEAAANKEITDEVVEALWDLLDIEEPVVEEGGEEVVEEAATE